MFKIQVLFLVVVLSLTACGSGSNGSNSSVANSSSMTSSVSNSQESSTQSSAIETSSSDSSSASSVSSTSSSSGESSISSYSSSFESASSSASSEQITSSSSSSVSSAPSSDSLASSTSSSQSSLGTALSLTVSPKAIKLFTFAWNPIEGATEYRLFERLDQGSGYSQVASVDSTLTEFELPVFLPEKVNASYFLQSCQVNVCIDSNVVDISGNLSEAIGYFKGDNPRPFDYFSWSLAFSADGSTLAVGAPSRDGEGILNSGAVYIFTRQNNIWVQQSYLTASNEAAGYGFGASLGLSHDGNTLAVGSLNEAGGSSGVNGNKFDDSLRDSGAVYIFTKTSSGWSEEAYLKASNPGEWDRFGGLLALSGDGRTLLVGAVHESSSAAGVNGDQADNSLASSGAAYVFSKIGNEWAQQAYLKAAAPQAQARFGYGLAISFNGSTAVVGAAREQHYAPVRTGSAYVFIREGDSWSQQAYLLPTTNLSHDFGGSLALSNDGNTLAIGAAGESYGDRSFAGAVYVFTRNSNSWTQQTHIPAVTPVLHGQFGYALGISGDGNKLVIGARGQSSDALGINQDQYNELAYFRGVAYVFTRSFGNWQKMAALNPVYAEERLSFGNSVAISAQGKDIAVGSIKESSDSVGINGERPNIYSIGESGAVYLY